MTKALSLWQPWASAIAEGAKRIETRSWQTHYRGPLLIHAGKKILGQDLPNCPCTNPKVLEIWTNTRGRSFSIPFGAIIVVCQLVGCMDTEAVLEWGSQYLADWDRPTEYLLGDYSNGRYGWVLSKVRKLPEPIPYKGRQGLFNVPEEVYKAVKQ